MQTTIDIFAILVVALLGCIVGGFIGMNLAERAMQKPKTESLEKIEMTSVPIVTTDGNIVFELTIKFDPPVNINENQTYKLTMERVYK